MAILPTATGVVADDLTLDWRTVDDGCEKFPASGAFELFGMIGQPDAGAVVTGGDSELTHGFRFGHIRGACNYDAGIDLFHFADYEVCITGPAGGLLPGCWCLDFDGDGSSIASGALFDISDEDVALPRGAQQTSRGAQGTDARIMPGSLPGRGSLIKPSRVSGRPRYGLSITSTV